MRTVLASLDDLSRPSRVAGYADRAISSRTRRDLFGQSCLAGVKSGKIRTHTRGRPQVTQNVVSPCAHVVSGDVWTLTSKPSKVVAVAHVSTRCLGTCRNAEMAGSLYENAKSRHVREIHGT